MLQRYWRFSVVDKQLQENKEISKNYWIVKRIFDICFSSLAIVLFAPVGLIIALIIKLDSKGSVLYVHERMGKNGGRILRLWTIRGLRAWAEYCAAPV